MASKSTPPFGAPKKRSNTPWIIGGLGLVAVLALIAGLTVTLTGGKEEAPTNLAQFRSATVTGAPLPPLPTGKVADPAVGNLAPAVSGQSFDGSAYSITPDGRAKVVAFYAHWCPHCAAELPGISRWLSANRAQFPNVDFNAVATGTDPQRPTNFPPSAWFAKEKYPLPVAADDRNTSIARAFGVGNYPFFVVLDKDHKVVVRSSGRIGVSGYGQLARRAAGS